jgi:molybdenum cofactor guanylyltransferase
MKILGSIIAGGRSSRMEDREKAFLKLAGKSILDLVIGRFEPQVDQLIINANGDPSRFSEFDLAVHPDCIATLRTPLAGLHASLALAKENGSDILITTPSDTPLLPIDMAVRLIEGASKTGAAIATSGGREHYLSSAWKVGLFADLEKAIAQDGLVRVKDWALRAHAAKVEWPAAPYDPFFNVNTPEDLAAADQIARGN